MITYTYQETNQEPEDFKDKVIVKTGHTVEFSLRNMEENEEYLKKKITEMKGTAENRRAVMKNVENYHDIVKTLSEQDRIAVHMHRHAEIEALAIEEKLKEAEDMLAKSLEEKEEIKKQLNINE
jgi:hypothetical protein